MNIQTQKNINESINDLLRLRLIVFQGHTILVDDILAYPIQKLQLETFFVQQNHLFCIRNSNQIVSYNLV